MHLKHKIHYLRIIKYVNGKVKHSFSYNQFSFFKNNLNNFHTINLTKATQDVYARRQNYMSFFYIHFDTNQIKYTNLFPSKKQPYNENIRPQDV